MTKTNAVRLLEAAGVAFRTHEYAVDEAALDAVSVAGAIGAEAERVFKTLIARADSGEALVFCVPGSAELDLKRAAAVAGARRVAMLPLRELEPMTGYVHGGCSPVGMKRRLPTWVDESAELFETIYVSGGRRGLQVELAPAALAGLVGASYADLTAR